MKRVIIESPYRGAGEENVAYARRALWDSIHRGEAPFASHLLYTQVLDDDVRYERMWGIAAGLVWMQVADLVAVYIDRGISEGMSNAITYAEARGIPVEHRSLEGNDG